MRGAPKHWNTIHDVNVTKELFPEAYKEKLQQIYDSRTVWEHTKELPAEAKVEELTTDTVKAVPVEDEKGVVTAVNQYELKLDPNCKLFKLGLTVAGIEKELRIDAKDVCTLETATFEAPVKADIDGKAIVEEEIIK